MKNKQYIWVPIAILLPSILVIMSPLRLKKRAYEPIRISGGEQVGRIVVQPYRIEGPAEEFGYVAAQISTIEGNIVLAQMDSYNWPLELFVDWQSTSIIDESLWSRVPTPTHIWVANAEAGVLEYGDDTSWQGGKAAVIFDSIEDSARERKLRLKDPMLSSKPGWWPDSETVGESSGRYGRVVPGRDALYYVMCGPTVRRETDWYGNVHYFGGPIRIVLADSRKKPVYIIEYVLETCQEFNGVTIRFDSSGRYLLAHTFDREYAWIIDLTDMWVSLQNAGE